MKLEPNQIIANRYQIIKTIGVGGMANVYCANDIKLDRQVTFKVLKEEFAYEEFIKKFMKEAMAAAKISHPNIASVYDAGNDGDIYYIVMEYIDGYTLKDIIKIRAPFSMQEILGISIQIASALSVAHNAMIVHRDIKPQNILITKEGKAKVTDFGVARFVSSNTITIDTVGSAHYFSPEQARGAFTDFKTDIYSLGIIMFEMATGKLPFEGEGVVQLAMKHINDPLPNIKEINSSVSESIEKIILKATQKNSDNRYQSADLLIEDLKMALYDQTGDFVKQNAVSESPTIMMTQEQIDTINEHDKDNKIEKENRKAEFAKYYNTSKGKQESIRETLKKQKERDRNMRVTFFAVLTALSIIIIITSFLIFWLVSGTKSEVPDFVGQTFEEAVEIAQNKEIYIRNTGEEYSDTIEEGAIISQSVEAGTSIKKGETVDVTISLGTGKFELMDFVGLDISEVYKQIEDVNINLVEEYINDSTVEIGKVIKQSPKAGTTVSMDDKVTIYISKGEEDVLITVPNVINLSEQNATQVLQNIGLSVGSVTSEYSDTIAEGKVISQSISYGTQVEQGKAINIVVSLGSISSVTEEDTTGEEDLEENLDEDTDITTEQTTQAYTETTEQTTQASVSQEAVLTIDPETSNLDDNVEVKIVRIVDGEESEIYVKTHAKEDFPLNITVRGNTTTQYQIYVDGDLISTVTKFD